MSTRVVGKCKKEISRVMPPFKGMPEKLAEEMKKEYKIEIGAVLHIDGPPPYDHENDEYSVYVNYEKIIMSRKEIDEHFDVVWEHGCYNTCIRDGIPCVNVGYIKEGSTDRTPYESNCCRIGWEIGRGDCSRYEPETAT